MLKLKDDLLVDPIQLDLNQYLVQQFAVQTNLFVLSMMLCNHMHVQ